MAKSYKQRYEELLENLKGIEEQSVKLHMDIRLLLESHNSMFIIDGVKEYLKASKKHKITAAWLQRRYSIGYARAAYILDNLKDMGIIR